MLRSEVLALSREKQEEALASLTVSFSSSSGSDPICYEQSSVNGQYHHDSGKQRREGRELIFTEGKKRLKSFNFLSWWLMGWFFIIIKFVIWFCVETTSN